MFAATARGSKIDEHLFISTKVWVGFPQFNTFVHVSSLSASGAACANTRATKSGLAKMNFWWHGWWFLEFPHCFDCWWPHKLLHMILYSNRYPMKSSQTTSSIRRAIKSTLPPVFLLQVALLKSSGWVWGKRTYSTQRARACWAGAFHPGFIYSLFVWKISLAKPSLFLQLFTHGPGLMGYSTVSCAPCLKSWFQAAALVVFSVAFSSVAKVGSTATWSGGRSSNQCEARGEHRPTELRDFWYLRWSDFPLPDENGAIVQRGGWTPPVSLLAVGPPYFNQRGLLRS